METGLGLKPSSGAMNDISGASDFLRPGAFLKPFHWRLKSLNTFNVWAQNSAFWPLLSPMVGKCFMETL